MSPRRTGILLALIAGAYLVYFHATTLRGVVSDDEPRYAAVAREMAESGDWITPRLHGEPWFEKPPLVYWMGAVGVRLGLPADVATRIPVAGLSLGFALVGFLLLRGEFGTEAAAYSIGILATSAGWVAYSQVGVFDLPLAASVGLALIVLLPWVEESTPTTRRRLTWFGALAGVSALAKGLVGPLLLCFALLAVVGERRWAALADLLHPRTWVPFLAVAGPWYAACYATNGWPFIEEFIVRHHFARLTSDSLRHVQPFWFYVPVVLAGLLPWTPLAMGLRGRGLWEDRRTRYLAVGAALGFVFFSISRNKLPGYVLPLFPATAILAGVGTARRPLAGWVLALCALTLALFPVVAGVLPEAIAGGISRTDPVGRKIWSGLALGALPVAALLWTARGQRRRIVAIAAWACLGYAYLKTTVYPALDRAAGTRTVWREIEARAEDVCVGDVRRFVRYGIRFYSRNTINNCAKSPKSWTLAGNPPEIQASASKD